jgi:hypothetical protein
MLVTTQLFSKVVKYWVKFSRISQRETSIIQSRRNITYNTTIYFSGLVTAVAVFRNPNIIPFCLTTDLLLNVSFSWLLVHLPSTFFLDVLFFFSPLVGTGKIKFPGWTKTSTAARQFDIELSRARGRKPWPKNHLALQVGGCCSGPAPRSSLKNKNAKKPNTKPRKCNTNKYVIIITLGILIAL